MADDFLNGLTIVSLGEDYATFRWTLSYTPISNEHPWKDLYQERDPPPVLSFKTPSIDFAPVVYKHENQLNTPRSLNNTVSSNLSKDDKNDCEVELHETIRLCDVVEFRKRTHEKTIGNMKKRNVDQIESLTGFSPSSSSIRPVIYRFINVMKNSMVLLEAIHFELFMPDRSDLRFLVVPFASVPAVTAEGDFFRVPDADLLSNPSFAVKLGKEEYPVVWEAKKIEKIECESQSNGDAMAFIKKRNGNISEIVVGDSSTRSTLIPGEGSSRQQPLVRVTVRHMFTAHLYPVEPPLPPLPIEKEELEEGEIEDEDKENPCSEYLKRVNGVRTSSQRPGRVVSAVHALDSTIADRIADRLGEFTAYGEEGDLQLMDELFRLGSRFRANASRRVDSKEADELTTEDAGEKKIEESIILTTIMNGSTGDLEECRPLLDCIYGRPVATLNENAGADAATDPDPDTDADADAPSSLLSASGQVQLNAQQSRAVRLYTDASGPRVFCILSPPGSGKTTVAAAMAAQVCRNMVNFRRYTEVPRARGRNVFGEARSPPPMKQLLLSVQNVAVDNIGAALKKMDYGGVEVYNMKSHTKLDPKNPLPFDFFDRMGEEDAYKWRTGTQDMTMNVRRNPRMAKFRRVETERFKSVEACLKSRKRQFEMTMRPEIILSTVEMALLKMDSDANIRCNLEKVSRIIIDEASLLTEAALYAIIRKFPKARIVLIGDDHQLPPFMYDEKILGQELAGRPALTVAMKTGRVPVVELNEVYRAPPSLVAPYNRLAYGGILISKKDEGESLLSEIGLIHSGMPQLLLIDVDGEQERNEKTMSLYNEEEIDVIIRLLKKFSRGSAKDIMIICLYKEQKERLQEVLEDLNDVPGNQYRVLTVDSAQGRESPIVILMTTRTERATGFFCSKERCNVAVSRQQKALIILGKASLLTTNKPWSTVVNGDDFTRIKAEDIT